MRKRAVIQAEMDELLNKKYPLEEDLDRINVGLEELDRELKQVEEDEG